MRALLIIALIPLSLISLNSFAAAEPNSNYFEKNLSKVGEKLDAAASKGQELGKKIERDWSVRLKAAIDELSTGAKRAWRQLKSQQDDDHT